MKGRSESLSTVFRRDDRAFRLNRGCRCGIGSARGCSEGVELKVDRYLVGCARGTYGERG